MENDAVPVRVHIHVEGAESLRRIEHKLDELLTMVRKTLKEEKRMSQQLDDLKAQVESAVTVEQSAVELLNGLSAQIVALKEDPAALEALAAELKEKTDVLAAAVTANTPTAPAIAKAPETANDTLPEPGQAGGGTPVMGEGTEV